MLFMRTVASKSVFRQWRRNYGIRNDEILVFGDGPNDVDMLRDVGFGVAMGNGCAKAKAAANYVTTDVDNDGIYRALKELGVI